MSYNNVYNDGCSRNTSKGGKIQHDNTKHYPNKDEASLLRQLMSSNGLTEEQVRSNKKYRIMLSEAQKIGQEAKRSARTKFYQGLIKEACKKTGLAPQHPNTIEVLDELLGVTKRRWRFNYHIRHENLSAKTIVNQYAK